MRIGVVGAGISGLATAFHIERLRPDWQVTVFEAASRPGGTMQTVEQDGFLFESGSNGFLSNKPDTLDLVAQAGANELLMRSNDAARIRYVFDGKLHRLPHGPGSFLTTSLLSVRQRLRVLAEPFIPRRTGLVEETLREFGDRRLGPAFTRKFLDPMSAGIFASTPDQLSVSAAFPAVVALERDHGGLFRGMLARRKRDAGPGGVLTSFHGGVGRFVDHLAARLAGKVHLASPVERLELNKGVWSLVAGGASHEFDKLVLATPAYVSSDLLAPLDKALAARLAAVEYSPISVVGFGYDALDHPLDGFGLLTTSDAGLDILGVLWDSSIFADRAPAGRKSLRVMIGGQRQPELAVDDESTLIERARQGLKQTMGIDAVPTTTFVQRWPRGIPNYGPGHLANVAAIERQATALPGIYLTGNAYRGVGINDCVANAVRCAQAVVR